jgi:apolipoprotein D and lipocalin family protein
MNNKISLFLTLLVYFFGCSSVQALEDSNEGPMPVVDYVDLDRFMGDWYVIATIPTFLEKDAYNPVETYKRDDDGTIANDFHFQQR